MVLYQILILRGCSIYFLKYINIILTVIKKFDSN
eukprot:UN23821